MFPEHATDPRDFRDGTIHTWGAKAPYGIRSEPDGRERRSGAAIPFPGPPHCLWLLRFASRRREVYPP